MPTTTSNSYCHHCGGKHIDSDPHPSCVQCGEICWINPAPVSVCLTPVIGNDGGQGLLLVERAIMPRGWALPGGFIEWGEQPGSAALRELMEETGLAPDDSTTAVRGVDTTPNGANVLIYMETQAIQESQLQEFIPNSETRGVQAVFTQEELQQAQIVFSSHQHFALEFLTSLLATA